MPEVVISELKTKVALGDQRLDSNADKHERESCSCVLPERLFSRST